MEIATKSELKPGDGALNKRVVVTGRSNAPDLCSVMLVIGNGRVRKRIGDIIN